MIAIAPSPVACLSRAVAVAERDGPAAALQLVDDLDLGGYYLLHDIRAELLSRLGRTADAAAEYDAAIACTDSAAQHRFLAARRAALDA